MEEDKPPARGSVALQVTRFVSRFCFTLKEITLVPRCLQILRKQTVAMDKHAGLGVRLGVLLLADPDCTSTRVLQG